MRYLIADAGTTAAGTFTLTAPASNAVSGNQKVIAQQYFDGANLVGILDTSPIAHLSQYQYTPTVYVNGTNPSAIGATATTPLTGSPTLDIYVSSAAVIDITTVVIHNGSAIGRTTFWLLHNINSAGYTQRFPFGDVEYLTSGQVNRGQVTFTNKFALTPGRNQFAVGGQQFSGTAVTPNSAYLEALVYGA
jgi:hypothetical protein